ncbi:SusC/RagA family TonB-linked outer membrane protein [Haliscomenobacter sp.]|uniref:SusC/RagA family TonB-linked outer membrane protein n=1 Tax=Haliscomenobacter sp. TaxID=2717303 RepID=UPI003BA85F20
MVHAYQTWQKYTTLVVVFCLFSIAALAQRSIGGKVVDVAGNPLIGASVIVKGTTNGTYTDDSGAFSLTIEGQSPALIVSYLGYRTKEVALTGAETNVSVTLEESDLALEEVLVTGYSTQQKKDLTGAVSVVKTKDLLSVPAGNFQQQLAGRAAGVVVGDNGEPGSPVSIRIRGVGTFGNNDPLYVIDGVPRDANRMVDLNPSDIETFQILKDASAASIYGSRAANGVIIITTKKGKAGQTKVSYSGYYGVQNHGKLIDVLNAQEWATMRFQALANAGLSVADAGQNIPQLYGTGSTPVLPDYIFPAGAKEGDPRVNPANYNADINSPNFNLITKANKQGTNWQEELYQTAPIQDHNLSFTGGNKGSVYALTLNYYNQEGLVIHTYNKRYSMRLNSEFKIGKYLSIGENMKISHNEDIRTLGNATGGSAITGAIQMQPIVPVYDINGFFGGAKGIVSNSGNPIADRYRQKDNRNYGLNAFGSLYTNLNLGFLGGIFNDFTFRSQIGFDYGMWNGYAFGYRNIEAAEVVSSNSFNQYSGYGFSWTLYNTLTFDRQLSEKQKLKVYVGTEAVLSSGRDMSGTRVNYFVDSQNFWTLNAGSALGQQVGGGAYSGPALYSVFGRVEYNLMDKYIINGTVRRDGSSVFGPENRYGVFPAFGVAWRVSSESFMQNVTFFNDMKLRFGWGQTGNQKINASNPYSTFGSGPGSSAYDINGTSTSPILGFESTRLGNPASKWETTTSTNIGIDATMLDNKLEVSLEWWNRRTTDLLYVQELPGTAGDLAAPAINIGDMKNVGVDAQLTYHGQTAGDKLKYNVGVTFGTYNNEILRVGTNDATFFTGGGTRIGNISRSLKGYPIASFYGYQVIGFFQNDDEIKNSPDQPGEEKVGRYRLADINGDGVVNESDQTFIGNPHPDFTYGVNLDLSFKNWDFSAFFQGSQGNELFNFARWEIDYEVFNLNRSKEALYDSWTPNNRDAALPRLDFGDQVSNSFLHSRYVEDGSYVALRQVQLGYSFQHIGKMKVDRLRLYLQATNPIIITKYRGYNPAITTNGFGDGADRAMGIDYGAYPVNKQLIIGANLTF